MRLHGATEKPPVAGAFFFIPFPALSPTAWSPMEHNGHFMLYIRITYPTAMKPSSIKTNYWHSISMAIALLLANSADAQNTFLIYNQTDDCTFSVLLYWYDGNCTGSLVQTDCVTVGTGGAAVVTIPTGTYLKALVPCCDPFCDPLTCYPGTGWDCSAADTGAELNCCSGTITIQGNGIDGFRATYQ